MTELKELELKDLKNEFEKGVNFLNNENCKRFIPIMKNKTASLLLKDKHKSGGFVLINENSDFVLMFFFHCAGLNGMQYLINKNILDPNILCGLYSEYVIKILKKFKYKHNYTTLELAKYYAKQITGYKEFLKKQMV